MRRALVVVFAVLAASIAFSLAGSTALTLAPEVAGRVGLWLPLLMRVPTWIYSAALPAAVLLAVWPSLGARRALLAAGCIIVLGAAAELLGTSTGVPFGAYAYTDFLGAKILGRVPYAIPPSWFAASMLSFLFASRAGLRGASRIAGVAVSMVLWDVALDPAMSAAFPVWEWRQPGLYYGMPLINWAGWFVTALIIGAALERICGDAAPDAGAWPARIWLVNGAFAIGLCLRAGMWPAALIGAVAVTLPPLLSRRARPRPVLENAVQPA